MERLVVTPAGVSSIIFVLFFLLVPGHNDLHHYTGLLMKPVGLPSRFRLLLDLREPRLRPWCGTL